MELKPTTVKDLETIFEIQADEDALKMAAFVPGDPTNKEAYMKKWTAHVANPNIFMRTMWVEGRIVGSIIHFDMGDETNIGYGIAKSEWGKGYATKALGIFVKETPKRPLHARFAFDNIGSQKVLEKNGFKCIGEEVNYAGARGKEIKEFIYLLE